MRKRKRNSKAKAKTATLPKKLDPLYQLFEHYLMNRSYDDTSAFTKQLAQDYLAYLDSTHAHVPVHLRESILEDLESEAHELLVRRMYGCVKGQDYENFGHVVKVGSTGLPEDFPSVLSSEEEEDDAIRPEE